jgi:two-component system sensor histidine kinase YesM
LSLQRKLIISFCIFLSVLFVTMILILLVYGSGEIESKAQDNLEVIGTQMVQQFDNLARPMDFITVNLISTNNFINSMSILSHIPKGQQSSDIYINQATRFIYTTLINDSINRNFYSVNVFNEQGDLFSSRTQQPNVRVPIDTLYETFPWITQVNDLHGKILLIPPRPDPWNESSLVQVFSLVRALYGSSGRVGYIEVQHTEGELEKIFTAPDSLGLKAVLLSEDGQIFYQSGFLTGGQAGEFIIENHEREYISLSQKSPYTGFTLMLYQDRKMLMQPLNSVVSLGGIMIFVLLAVSVLFAFTLYRQLIKPIRILRQQMESIELETLRAAAPTGTSLDGLDVLGSRHGTPRQDRRAGTSLNDLVALENTFSMMRERLGEAITRQLRSRELQMQANYDALQLQINPHFLNNVLHVLSQKGLEKEDTEICEICSDLASMMRYSTSTLERQATIREELKHVTAYVSLMQKRYENRIDFHVCADEETASCEMPKMTLQQFVENSINHSFAAGHKNISIEITCKKQDNGWHICVSDNGPGFSPETLSQLEGEMPELRRKLPDKNTEFAIGGMGLLNTYARLWLFFGDSVELIPGNNEEGGAYVIIEYKKGDERQ